MITMGCGLNVRGPRYVEPAASFIHDDESIQTVPWRSFPIQEDLERSLKAELRERPAEDPALNAQGWGFVTGGQELPIAGRVGGRTSQRASGELGLLDWAFRWKPRWRARS